MAGCERTVTKADGKIYSDVNTEQEFTVDEEGVSLFFEFEFESFMKRYANSDCFPTSVYHYFMRLGIVSLSKGGHSQNDRMLRMANQIHRLNIANILNDPDKLISALGSTNKINDAEINGVQGVLL